MKDKNQFNWIPQMIHEIHSFYMNNGNAGFIVEDKKTKKFKAFLGKVNGKKHKVFLGEYNAYWVAYNVLSCRLYDNYPSKDEECYVFDYKNRDIANIIVLDVSNLS